MTKTCDYCGEQCGPVKEVRGTSDDWVFDGTYYHQRCLPENWREAFDVLAAQEARKPEPPKPEPEMDHCPTCGQLTRKSDIIGLPHAYAHCSECREEAEQIRRMEP